MTEPRYIVTAQWPNPDTLTTVYRGNDEARAIEVANFWDERVNTYFVDIHRESALNHAMRRFDEAIARLTGSVR